MNSKKITVSAVVPAFNEAPRISNVLAFLESCPDVDEIVCVDDGSEDKTSEIVKSKFPDVKLITLPQNKGKGNALAEGTLAAKGEIILFVDADLIGLCPEHIHKLLIPVITKKADVVVSARDYWADNIFFRALSGERTYRRKNLLPLLPEMRSLRYKVEIFLNYKFNEAKVKPVLLEGVYNPYKWQKKETSVALKDHWVASKQILDHILEQESPLEFFYKSYLKNFYFPFDTQSFSFNKGAKIDKQEETLSNIKKTVSVVIPAHNEEKYIGKTLESLKKQTVKADEIIVVDNCSTDKTSEIAEAFGCRVIKERRKGTCYARNTGFNAAAYDTIARTDADTIVDTHWIERIKKYRSHDIQAFTGPVFLDAPIVKTNPHAIDAFMLLLKLMFGHTMWLGANMVMSKEVWNKAKKHVIMDDKKIHEDVDLALAVNRYYEIQYKKDLIVLTSSRRMKNNPKSIFVEYQLRLLKMAAKKQSKNIRSYYSKIKIFLEQDIFSEDW